MVEDRLSGGAALPSRISSAQAYLEAHDITLVMQSLVSDLVAARPPREAWLGFAVQHLADVIDPIPALGKAYLLLVDCCDAAGWHGDGDGALTDALAHGYAGLREEGSQQRPQPHHKHATEPLSALSANHQRGGHHKGGVSGLFSSPFTAAAHGSGGPSPGDYVRLVRALVAPFNHPHHDHHHHSGGGDAGGGVVPATATTAAGSVATGIGGGGGGDGGGASWLGGGGGEGSSTA
eukprot:CAMPEP_0171962196 /NCGR_PEP_ID=MMETSP0993-20121228/167482_1 /TAXON_ID=483369 /ORGANISM="non described non described, Strain CCMP2098" /LENGTH=234 /DNA_ID=CAMNT_0012610465 /DNA_START=135 /DNA_END=835 /DNA_ORIENTATION=-